MDNEDSKFTIHGTVTGRFNSQQERNTMLKSPFKCYVVPPEDRYEVTNRKGSLGQFGWLVKDRGGFTSAVACDDRIKLLVELADMFLDYGFAEIEKGFEQGHLTYEQHDQIVKLRDLLVMCEVTECL